MRQIKKKFSIVRVMIGLVVAAVIIYIAAVGVTGVMPSFIGSRRQESTYEKIEYTELTKEQRLEDFDHLFSIIETSLPCVYAMDELYGYSVLGRRDEYRKRIEDCADDYVFLAEMSAIAGDIPSAHAYLCPPDFGDYFSSGYYRTEVGLAMTDNFRGRLDAYEEQLSILQKKYDETGAELADYFYCDGKYISFEGELCEIISINGEDPCEFGVKKCSFSDLNFDSRLQKAYRTDLYFSTKGTEAVEVRVRNPRGDIAKRTLYTDRDMVFYCLYRWLFTDEHIESDTDEIFESAPAAEEGSILVETDEEHSLAYAYLGSVNYSSGEYMRDELKKVCGYENIIIDLRGNSGGQTYFWKEYIYPALYKDDAYFEYTGYVPETPFTDRLFTGWFGGAFQQRIYGLKFKEKQPVPEGAPPCSASYAEYTFHHDMKGDPDLEYPENRNVYFFCNEYTCSSADEILQIVKQCGLGTVVGTDTMGEGLIFGICCDWLPNSLLMLDYAPVYAIDPQGADTSLQGTHPDVYSDVTVENMMLMRKVKSPRSLEGRKKWDSCLNYVLDRIESE